LAVEAHKGTIGIESDFGKGTSLWFELPIPKGAAVKKMDQPIGDITTPQIALSKEAILFLKPYVLELDKIPYYKISTLRSTIQGITPPESIGPAVNKWLEQFKEAAAIADRDLIKKLIHEILDENA